MMMDVLYSSLLLWVALFASWLLFDWALRGKMSAFYLVSGMITLGLLVYLFVALLNPERFG